MSIAFESSWYGTITTITRFRLVPFNGNMENLNVCFSIEIQDYVYGLREYQ